MNEKSRSNKDSSCEEAAIFLEGYLTACKEMEIPIRAVSIRLGQILSASGPRTSKYMSKLRTDAKRDLPKRKLLEPLESNGDSHRRAQATAKKQLKPAQKLALAKAGKLKDKNGRRITLKSLRSMRATAAKAHAARLAQLAAKQKEAA